MVKSVLAVNHQGLRDWIVQRVSALIMAAYSIPLIIYLISHASLTYAEWHYLFSLTWFKVATLLFLISLVYHAWIGMWTIFTDYIKPFALRCFLHTVVFLGLAAFLFWGIMILWGV